MSEHALPSDPAQWPRDPFRLLGVSRGVSPQELKRSYLRLIRQYKPEQAPVQFRLIRDAYEAASRQNVSIVQLPREEDDFERPVRRKVAPAQQETHTPPPPTFFVEPWDRALQGEEERAYRELVEQAGRHPGDPEAYLQLYWLLTWRRDLDPARKPRDWLLSGLRASTGCWGLAMLLGRELALDPQAALDEGTARVLREGTSPGAVLVVAEGRWKAARLLRRWDVILSDVKSLRGWLGVADEAAWCRALVAAAKQVIWSEGRERDASRLFSREVDQHHHVQRDFAEPLAQLDFAREVAAGWSALRWELGFRRLLQNEVRVGWTTVRTEIELAKTLRELIPLSWDADYEEFRALHEAYLVQVVRNPPLSMAFFDRVHERSPAVIGHLSSLLDQRRHLRRSGPPARDPAAVGAALIDQLAADRRWAYNTLRFGLLAFCRHEAAAPEVLVGALDAPDNFAVFAPKSLARQIEADRPLQYVYGCCAALKAGP